MKLDLFIRRHARRPPSPPPLCKSTIFHAPSSHQASGYAPFLTGKGEGFIKLPWYLAIYSKRRNVSKEPDKSVRNIDFCGRKGNIGAARKGRREGGRNLRGDKSWKTVKKEEKFFQDEFSSPLRMEDHCYKRGTWGRGIKKEKKNVSPWKREGGKKCN